MTANIVIVISYCILKYEHIRLDFKHLSPIVFKTVCPYNSPLNLERNYYTVSTVKLSLLQNVPDVANKFTLDSLLDRKLKSNE